MANYRRGNHTVTRLTIHIVLVTKYRHRVPKGEIQKRCMELIMQVCDAKDIRILGGVVSKDHVHILIEYPPYISASDLVKSIKVGSSRLLQKEYSELQKRYWGRLFWAIWFGAWSTGNMTEKFVEECLEHHRNSSNYESNNFLLEYRTFSPLYSKERYS